MSAERLGRDDATKLLAAPKDAHGAVIAWTPITHPSGIVVSFELPTVLVVTDPPVSSGAVVIRGTWRTPNNFQIRLAHLNGSDEYNITRLCLCPQHPAYPHWHHLEALPGGQDLQPLSHPPSSYDHDCLLHEVFIPTMNVVNAKEPML